MLHFCIVELISKAMHAMNITEVEHEESPQLDKNKQGFVPTLDLYPGPPPTYQLFATDIMF